jgi:hypothetical protein
MHARPKAPGVGTRSQVKRRVRITQLSASSSMIGDPSVRHAQCARPGQRVAFARSALLCDRCIRHEFRNRRPGVFWLPAPRRHQARRRCRAPRRSGIGLPACQAAVRRCFPEDRANRSTRLLTTVKVRGHIPAPPDGRCRDLQVNLPGERLRVRTGRRFSSTGARNDTGLDQRRCASRLSVYPMDRRTPAGQTACMPCSVAAAEAQTG